VAVPSFPPCAIYARIPASVALLRVGIGGSHVKRGVKLRY
jgi:hypothetical protein